VNLEFFNPRQLIEIHGGTLPHWQQGFCPQFITFRAQDSLPQSILREWREAKRIWLEHNPEPHSGEKRCEYHLRFTRAIEDYLDRGLGACILREAKNREILKDVIMHAQGDKVEHHSWVIMPNHVHLLCTPRLPLADMMKIWKGTSAHRIGGGSLWRANYRDTLIRNETHFLRVMRYIRENPKHLTADAFTLWESEAIRRIQ
jgi:putative transposase